LSSIDPARTITIVGPIFMFCG